MSPHVSCVVVSPLSKDLWDDQVTALKASIAKDARSGAATKSSLSIAAGLDPRTAIPSREGLSSETFRLKELEAEVRAKGRGLVGRGF